MEEKEIWGDLQEEAKMIWQEAFRGSHGGGVDGADHFCSQE